MLREKAWKSAVAGMAAVIAVSTTALNSNEAVAQGAEIQPAASRHVWDPELLELHDASNAASDYAENNYGVGVLIHVGHDFPNRHFETADQFGTAVVNAFRQRHGVDAAYFLRQNDIHNTGLTFHIGHLVHGADNGTEVKNVKQALAAMPDVVEQLRIAKQLAVIIESAPEPTGG